MSMLVEHSVLAELEQRAGASDQDREAWMADRRNGLTATQIRDLVLKGPSYRRELIAQKLGQVADEGDLSHVPVIGWGRRREPIIAQAVQERYAIAPEHRVFRALDNPRFLASPDGVGVDFLDQLVISEIKTGWEDLSVGSEAYIRKGYGIQQCWGMRVTGARRSLYAWEYRMEDETREFVPGDVHFEWVEYDEKLAAELEQVADEFLAELDAARAALEAGEGPVIDEELDTLALNLLRFRVEESEAKKAKEAAWAGLHERLGERGVDFSQRSALAQITYTAAVESTAEVVDEEAAIAADPKLWASVERAEKALAKKRELWREHAAGFTKSVPSTKKAGLTVTSVKQKAAKADG